MGTNYGKIIRENLATLYAQLPHDLEKYIGADKNGENFSFMAFGEECCMGPSNITLSGKPAVDPRGLLISLYAIHANPQPMQLEPFKSFRDLPDTMPYHAAFRAHSENVLVPHVPAIRERQHDTIDVFGGQHGLGNFGGDFSFILYPLPRIALCYIFYLPDEEFPASANCLFSANALSYMPIDGLADVAEYTSKGIIRRVQE